MKIERGLFRQAGVNPSGPPFRSTDFENLADALIFWIMVLLLLSMGVVSLLM